MFIYKLKLTCYFMLCFIHVYDRAATYKSIISIIFWKLIINNNQIVDNKYARQSIAALSIFYHLAIVLLASKH